MVPEAVCQLPPFTRTLTEATPVLGLPGSPAIPLTAAGNDATSSYESSSINFGNDQTFAGSYYDFDPSGAVDTRQRITLAVGANMSFTIQWDDPFYTTKPIGQGTGMGLSISYQIVVDRHGGTLDCISAIGSGTKFIITLPIKH